jgi:hypothetical protein
LLEFFRGGLQWSQGVKTHVMSNVVVDFDPVDPDRAYGRTTGVAWLRTPTGNISTRGLHYDDVFVRRGGVWRFAERSHHADWEYQVPMHRIEVIGQPWDGQEA